MAKKKPTPEAEARRLARCIKKLAKSLTKKKGS